MKGTCTFFCVITALLFQTLITKATHNRSGEILYYKIPGAYTYSIVVIKYTGDGPNVADRCEDTVYFGDGSKGVLKRINGNSCVSCPTAKCGEVISSQSNYRVKKNVYSIVHTFPGPGNYLISSTDKNRSAGSVNLPNSVNLPFYLESLLTIQSNDLDNSSPQLTRHPIDQAILYRCFYTNPCAFDPDGDSLSFEMINPRSAGGKELPGYSLPDAGPNGNLSLDPETGLFTWCNPQTTGFYNVAIKVSEWRKQNCLSGYTLKGYVIREMEIMVEPYPNAPSLSLSGVPDVCIQAGDELVQTLVATSSNSYTTFSFELFGFVSSSLTGEAPANLSVINSAGTGSAKINWWATCNNYQPGYQYIHLVATTKNSAIPIRQYQSFRVKIVPPLANPVMTVINSNNIRLSWDRIQPCKKLDGYQVFRAPADSLWQPGPCRTVIPPVSGYSLIASLKTGQTADTIYVDTSATMSSSGNPPNYLVVPFMRDCLDNGTNEPVSKAEELEELTVFPNPADKQFEIRVPGKYDEPLEVRLLSIDGKIVYQNIFSSVSRIVIDNSNLAEGVFILEVKSNNEFFRVKVLKN